MNSKKREEQKGMGIEERRTRGNENWREYNCSYSSKKGIDQGKYHIVVRNQMWKSGDINKKVS